MIKSAMAQTMKASTEITCLFVDIGGVLLTDGWVHDYRVLAAKTFGLDPVELEMRHHQAYETHEAGMLSLEDYLKLAIFYRERPFTRDQFEQFMFAQSKPYPKMIELVRNLKSAYGLKIVVVSNEGRELNAHRIHAFELDGFVDAFISSCFVHHRKPDVEIFRHALDVAQAPAGNIIYIENTPMFVQIAEGLGIRSILHTDYKTTRNKLAALGLDICEPAKSN
ncbi:MAG: HAD family phosphatase [Chthoniobacterales bacterium]